MIYTVNGHTPRLGREVFPGQELAEHVAGEREEVGLRLASGRHQRPEARDELAEPDSDGQEARLLLQPLAKDLVRWVRDWRHVDSPVYQLVTIPFSTACCLKLLHGDRPAVIGRSDR